MSRPLRTRVTALVAGAAALLCLGGLLGMTPAAYAPTVAGASAGTAARQASTASATSTPSPRSANTVDLSIAAGQGGVAHAGHALSATAEISNGASGLLDGGTLTLWASTVPITGRTGLKSWMGGSGEPAGSTELGGTSTLAVTQGESSTVSLKIPASSMKLAEIHTTTVLGIGGSLSVDGKTVATARSSLVVEPKGSGASTGDNTDLARLSVAMPMTVPATADGVIGAKDLAAYTAPDGILTREVDGLLGHPDVAVGLDPMIVASIRMLGTAAPQSALNWRDTLLTLPNEIFPLRYGDADAAAEAQAGLSRLLKPTSFDWAMQQANHRSGIDSAGETPQPTTAGGEISPSPTPSAGAALPSTAELLSWPYTLSGVVWPAEGEVSSPDLSVFAKSGLTTTIVSSDNVKGAPSGVIPNAAFAAGKNTVIASDSALSTALRSAVTAGSDTAWGAAVASLNSQLELIDAKRQSPTLLLTLGRIWPTDSARLSNTLGVLAESPWASEITLPQALRVTPTHGLALKSTTESATRVQRVRDLLDDEKRVDAFASVLTEPKLMKGRQRATLLSLLSVSWRNPQNDWASAVGVAKRATERTLTAISIIPASNVNVASTEAPIPVTVENKLTHAVQLVLTARPSNGRLEIDGDAHKTFQADSRGTISVPVKASLGNGKVRLNLQLYSTTGVQIGAPATIPVQVHAQWEGIVAAVLAVLVVGLFGFGLVRTIRRHRAERRAEPADG